MYSDEAAAPPGSPPRPRLNESAWRPRRPPHDEPGLPPIPGHAYGQRREPWPGSRHAADNPGKAAQPRFLTQPARPRHVTFSVREPHLDKATGNIEHVHVRNTPRHDDPPQDSEEEHFVDGSYFFNHLVRNKEAEDYNMAEMLRERSRELQRRRLFGRGADTERLSTSLPTDYFVTQPTGQYCYREGMPREPQDRPFADGLEIEIPPRRHAGLGGGGLRQSLSADRLLMVPPTHRDSSRFGRNYFHSGLATEHPTSYSSANLMPRPLSPGSRAPENYNRNKTTSYSFNNPMPRPLSPGSRHPGNYDQNNMISYSSANVMPKSLSPGSRNPETYDRSNTTSYSSANLMLRPLSPGSRNPENYDRGNATSYSSANTMPRPLSPGSRNPENHDQSKIGVGYTRYGKPGAEPVTNRYNVRTGRFEPDVETPPELPPKAPAPKMGPIRYESDRWDNHQNVEIARPGKPPVDPRNRLHDANRTWSAQFEGHQQHDPRLSVSFDPARFRAPDYRTQNAANAMREFRRVAGNASFEPQPQRKVTWRDQEPRWRPHAEALDLSRTHPGGSFQENLAFEDQESSRDDTRSTFREGFSYPSSDSLMRSLAVNDLHNVDQFALFEVSTSKLNWAESFMGTNSLDKMMQYKFVVLNRHEEVLFFGAEDDCSISNCILSPQKSSFKVRLLDANGNDFVHFRRLYPVKPKTNLTIGNKKKYRLEVSTPSGHVIGNVEKTYNSDTYYILEDRAGACLFLVQRSCICTCPLFWDYEFKILMPEGDAEVGEISWSYLTAQDEQFNGTEISFPMDLNTTSKIMLLGVCFLLNFSRWQSAYLDSMHNPRARKGRARRGTGDESREVAALLKTSPEEHGFHGDEEAEEVGASSFRDSRGRVAEGHLS